MFPGAGTPLALPYQEFTKGETPLALPGKDGPAVLARVTGKRKVPPMKTTDTYQGRKTVGETANPPHERRKTPSRGQPDTTFSRSKSKLTC